MPTLSLSAGVHSSPTDLNGPYYSARRDRDISLNGQARVGDALLSCTNLSVLWESSFNERNASGGSAGKPDYRHFRSVEALQAHAPPDIEARAGSRVRAEVQFVDNPEWGARIADAFQAMEASGRTHRSFQVHTPYHAMALGLRVKTQEGSPSYVVKFYDPNRTATHLRAQAGGPDAFRRMTALDFVRDPDTMTAYGMEAHSGSVVFLGDPLPDPARQPVAIAHVDRATLRYLLDLGLVEGIARFGDMVRAARLDAGQVAALLAVRSEKGVPGLSILMDRDQGDTIRAYGDMLVHANLDATHARELLACRYDDGVPGLHVAMQDDKPEAIRAWGEVALRCQLDPPDLVELLAARRPDGTSGLSMAAWLNNDRAILAHGKILLASGLPATTVAELLESQDRAGVPALYVAMQVGGARAIRAYGAVLVKSATDALQRMRLLAATGPDGATTGLMVALRNEHPNAVRAYGTVLAASGLDRSQLGQLLGVSGDTAPAMTATLQHATPAMRQAYFALLQKLMP